MLTIFPRKKQSQGFTLVEVLVGAAVFLIVSLAAYNAYIALFRLIDLSQYKILAINLANEQFEIARNMPYDDVGVVGGIPSGKLVQNQTLVRGGVTFTVRTIVRNLDLPFDGVIGGTPNDLSPADNKLVDITVSCGGCKNMQPISLTGQVAPKNLETASTNGALFVRVFDANGQPVQGATVQITNVATSSTIFIEDVTDATGMLQIVDVPPDTTAYRIIVTKDGYSTDRTYPPGAPGNPTPSKPDATVLLQQVTQISFAIDKLGALNIASVSPTCSAVPDFNFALVSSKTIGVNLPKFSQNLVTNGSGILDLDSMEWDTYTVIPTDTSYVVTGLNPLNPVTVNPDTTHQMNIIAVPYLPQSVLVTVKDSATQLPVSGAEVTMTRGAWSSTKTTGKGFINQTDWAGGPGQDAFVLEDQYFADDAGVDVDTVPGEVTLRNAFGIYNLSGTLESSTFDTGSISNFYTLTWSPTDQPVDAGADSVRFQIATATTTTPASWEYLGPDGTSATFYTTPDSPINEIHNGDRYLRYKMYLRTDLDTVTPHVSDVAFTFTSSCTPPGQVIFSNLANDDYHIEVTKDGYIDFNYDVSANVGWQEVPVVLTQ
jgi:prepilin-type N-terminal cleavage/methylation domain-containing protein